MTILQSFTDYFPKSRLTLFSDFISSAKPFGIVKSNNATIGVPTDVYSNGNSNALGSVTCTLGSGTSGAVFANRIGIYQVADQAGSIITRAWDIRNGNYAVEARLSTSVHPSQANIMTCGFSLNHNEYLEVGAYFYHLNGQSTWKAAVSAGSVTTGAGSQNIIREFETGIPVSQYQILRVESSNAGRRFEFFANGREIWKWLGNDVADKAAGSAFAMPCIELRDRVAGGGGRPNSFIVDYMMTQEEMNR